MKIIRARDSGSARAVVAAGTAALLVAAGVTVVLVRGADDDATLADAARVLQSVSASVASDGTITALEGTVVAIDAEGASSTSAQEYSPDEVAEQLPVRVLTSYRTDEGSGTDLDDLEGHDGPVEIALTVENTTVRPQELSYDVAGNQRTQSALVGIPLSVVASTSLGDLDPATVQTEGARDEATNGVLSRTEDGDTQVQWATILAPPQLGSSATLRLVVDAEDFSPPDFDLSVQPGLVTDPSLGALIDAAFNPAASEELRLQQRTIALIGEVNTVLSRAGASIADVRRTLRRSAQTIGVKTVEDLRTSTRTIARSMSSLDQAVESLGTDLSSTLESTGSTALQQLERSLADVDGLLGDTRQQAPTVQVRGSGCEATVPLPGRAESLYSSLLSVSGQLDGYARASAQCKGFVQQRLIDTIGTDDPEDCLDEDGDPLPQEEQSVTCVLFGVAERFESVGRSLEEERDRAIAALTDLPYDEVTAGATTLSSLVTDIETATTNLRDPNALEVALAQLTAVDQRLDSLEAQLVEVHERAEEEADEVGEPAAADSIAAQVVEIRDGVCAIDTLELAEQNALSVNLVGTPCALAPGGTPGSLSGRVEDQQTAWESVAADTDVEVTGSGAGAELAAARDAAGRLRAALDQGRTDTVTDANGNPQPVQVGGVERLLDALDLAVNQLDAVRDQIGEDVAEIDAGQQAAIDIITQAFADAQEGVSEDVGQAVAEETTRLVRRTAEDARDIGAAFDRSSRGLTTAGQKIRSDGRETIATQRRDLGSVRRESTQALTQSVRQGLQLVERGVSGSTRDTEAATRLLQADLANVLLDIGTRRVAGSGLLGAMATSAATAGTADVQLALATETTSSFAGVRSGSIAGLYLRQAQADAAFARQAEQTPFGLDLPEGTQHRAVFGFHLRTGQ